MASPFTYGSVTNMPNGPGAGTDNLTALPSATAYGLGVITNTPPLADCLVPPIKFETGSGATTGGVVNIYLITSEDNTIWTDGVSPTAQSNQKSKILTAVNAVTVPAASANTTYYIPEFSVLAALGFAEMPTYCAVVIDNETGGALHATSTNFSANYLPITWT